MPATWRSVFVNYSRRDASAHKDKGVVRLGTDIKKVSAVQLVGYYLAGFENVSHVFLHIPALSDHSTLLMNDINSGGAVRQGAFAACFHRPKATSRLDAEYVYDANGLACATFTPRNMPTLTVRLTDEFGEDFPDPTGTWEEGREALFWLRILTDC